MLTLDVRTYHRALTDDERREVDAWVDAHFMAYVTALTWGEGWVDVERVLLDQGGKPVVRGDEVVTVTTRIPCTSPPLPSILARVSRLAFGGAA